MTKVTPQIISTITQKHLHTKTLDEIVAETGLSKGTVYKIVKDWNQRLGGTDIEEIRAFISTVKKSGMTIQECATGFRIAHLLKGLGIRDDFDFDDKRIPQWLEKNHDDEDDDLYTNELSEFPGIKQNKKFKKAKSTGGNQILYFIEKIYRNCKKFDVQPSVIINWIQDLFVCYSTLEYTYPDNNAIDNKNISKNKKSFPSLENQEESIKVENEENKSRKAIITSTSTTVNTDIPFVSKISYYIEEKKQELKYLKNNKKAIYLDIKEATSKREAVIHELENLISQKRQVDFFSMV